MVGTVEQGGAAAREPDLEVYLNHPELVGGFAEVIKWAIGLGFGYSWTNSSFKLYRGDGTTVIEIANDSVRDNAAQAARSLLQSVRDELASG